MKKILIFYTSVGLGHKYIAQNIGKQLEASGFEVKLEDMLVVQAGNLVDGAQKFYLWMLNTVPWFWNWLYITRLTELLRPFRTMVAAKNSDNAKKVIAEYNPDMIISAEVNPSAVVAYLKSKGFYTKPFGICFSDPHLHHFWLYNQADFYLANIPEQKEAMIKRGIPAEKILVMGIPLSPLSIDRDAVKKRLGINSGKVILVSAGSLAFGVNKKYIRDMLSHLSSKLSDFTLVLVCGKMQTIYDELSQIVDPHFKVFGFYSPMDELYAIADVFVGKPGGLSTTEALYWRLPIILTHWMPGGEDLNVKYLTKNRLVLPVADPKAEHEKEIVEQIASEAQTGHFKQVLETQKELLDSFVNTDPRRIAEFIKPYFN